MVDLLTCNYNRVYKVPASACCVCGWLRYSCVEEATEHNQQVHWAVKKDGVVIVGMSARTEKGHVACSLTLPDVGKGGDSQTAPLHSKNVIITLTYSLSFEIRHDSRCSVTFYTQNSYTHQWLQSHNYYRLPCYYSGNQVMWYVHVDKYRLPLYVCMLSQVQF